MFCFIYTRHCKIDIAISYTSEYRSVNQMLNWKPFNDQTNPHDLNTKLVCYSDHHFIQILTVPRFNKPSNVCFVFYGALFVIVINKTFRGQSFKNYQKLGQIYKLLQVFEKSYSSTLQPWVLIGLFSIIFVSRDEDCSVCWVLVDVGDVGWWT